MKHTIPFILTPVLAVTLAACGGGDKESGGAAGPSQATSSSAAPGAGQQAGQHNQEDVKFGQMMIPHHQQALEMAKAAKTKAAMPEVKKLAADIEKAQDPEIKQMTAWLTSWGASMPAPEMTGMDHGGMNDGGGMKAGEHGMMSAQDMQKLEKLSGMAYDKAFLEMMIKHHQGAVTMAKKQQTAGQFPAAKAMAGTIVTSQTAEIATMQGMLKKM
ncbi:hypothetical protein GCM10010191_70290 [Actinomadura vinacea]|uniref:DUF305 domain-containing protein n=1 Tax=Actinomadura vinacea TaxID=115336 RepID=A0ABN3JYY1_9ACTN